MLVPLNTNQHAPTLLLNASHSRTLVNATVLVTLTVSANGGTRSAQASIRVLVVAATQSAASAEATFVISLAPSFNPSDNLILIGNYSAPSSMLSACIATWSTNDNSLNLATCALTPITITIAAVWPYW